MAILDVPFFFQSVGKRPREREPGTEILIGMAPVKVAEIADADAPVVGRCRYTAARPVVDERGRLATEACEAETDYRLLDGRLMRRSVLTAEDYGTGLNVPPVAAPLLADRHIGAALAAAVAAVGGPAMVTVDLAQSAMYLRAAAMKRYGEGLVFRKPGEAMPRRGLCCLEAENPQNRVDHTDRRQRAAELGRVMAGAALVDGVLYLPSWGPGWEVVPGRDGYLVDVIPEIGSADERRLEDVFQAGQEAAITAALAVQCGGHIPPLARTGAVEMDAAAYPLGPNEIAIRECAQGLVTRMGEAFLKARNPRLLHALADVMAGVQDLDGDAEAMLPALREIADVWQVILPEGDPRVWVCHSIDALSARVDTRQAATNDAALAAPIR